MLPKRPEREPKGELDGKYADDVMELFMRELKKTNTRPSDYQCKIFGGSNMFPAIKKAANTSVPEKNIEAGKALMRHYGFKIIKEDISGEKHRNLFFELWNGDVWLKSAKGFG